MDMNTPELITSFKNPRIQFIRDLLASRKSREENNVCVVEGVRLAEEAVRAGSLPQLVVFSDGLSSRGLALVSSLQAKQVQLVQVPNDLMAKISAMEADQGLLLVVEPTKAILPDSLDFVVILDGIKDPGNMGTILRSAAAAATQLVIITPGCVDVYSPKVLRAGMGAHFQLPIVAWAWAEINDQLKAQSEAPGVYLAESSHGKPIWEFNLKKPSWLIIGSEAEGASADARHAATDFALIPMPGKSESLNAAVAAGIFLFEVVRQRSQ